MQNETLHGDYKWVRSEEIVQTEYPTGNDYLGIKYCSQFTIFDTEVQMMSSLDT